MTDRIRVEVTERASGRTRSRDVVSGFPGLARVGAAEYVRRLGGDPKRVAKEKLADGAEVWTSVVERFLR